VQKFLSLEKRGVKFLVANYYPIKYKSIQLIQMQNLETKYYEFLTKLFRFDNKIKIYPVDFAKPWYNVFWHEKVKFGIFVFFQVANSFFDGVLPLLVGGAIESRLFFNLLWLMLVYFLVETNQRVLVYFWHIAIGNSQASILMAIQTYFLSVDPIKHATKSSGQIISKVQVASGQAFMVMVGTVLFDVLPTVATYFAVAISMLYYDIKVGIVAIFFFVFITAISIFLRYFHSISVNKPWIKARDQYVANQVENLTQNALIRSTFATPEQLNKSRQVINQTVAIRAVRMQGNSINTYIMRVLYTISIVVIGYLIFNLLEQNSISVVLATTLLLTYLNGSRSILKIGDMVAQVTESNADIVDLYKFINNFGNQTFPVIEQKNNHK
jgi:ABC-type multidrug transport system fused ATPase/permease subunit